MSESLPLPPSQDHKNDNPAPISSELQGALKVAQIPARTAKTTKEVVARVQQGLDALFWGVRRNSEKTLQALGAFTAIALTLGGLADGKTERTIAEGEIRIEQGDENPAETVCDGIRHTLAPIGLADQFHQEACQEDMSTVNLWAGDVVTFTATGTTTFGPFVPNQVTNITTSADDQMAKNSRE